MKKYPTTTNGRSKRRSGRGFGRMKPAHPCEARFRQDAACRMLRPALALALRGIPVFPCRTDKRPCTEHGFKDSARARKKLVDWWTRWPDANIGVPTGVRTGCFVLDVDEGDGKHGKAALAELVARHGLLPTTREVRTPRGGRHLYFKHTGEIHNRMDYPAPGLDVRGDGGYVLVPPSKTEHGLYEYVRERPLAECPSWLLDLLEGNVTETIEAICSMVSVPLCNSPVSSLDDLILRTTPSRPGERNRLLLNFARGLRFNLGMANRPFPELKPIVRRWYKAALPAIGTKAFPETWSDFVHAWPRVRLPLGGDVLSDAWHRAKTESPPAVATAYEDMEKIRLLVCLCWELASLSPSKNFFLSAHVAARLLDASPMGIHRWLRMLVADKVLEVKEIGNERKATRYRWTAGKEGNHERSAHTPQASQSEHAGGE